MAKIRTTLGELFPTKQEVYLGCEACIMRHDPSQVRAERGAKDSEPGGLDKHLRQRV